MREAHEPRLKALQRLLLARALHCVTPRNAAHGFPPGRSIAKYPLGHLPSSFAVVVLVEYRSSQEGAHRQCALARATPDLLRLLLRDAQPHH